MRNWMMKSGKMFRISAADSISLGTQKEAPLTKFQGYHDGTDFYFCFEVTDENVVTQEEWKDDESTVDNEDRVELFFAGGQRR